MEDQNYQYQNDQGPSLTEISEAILRFSEAAVNLKQEGILGEAVIQKANDVAMILLGKLEECENCAEFDCCKEPCDGQFDDCDCQGGNYDNNSLNGWFCNLNFTSDVQNNYNLFFGMDLNAQQGSLQHYYDIIGQPEVFQQFLQDSQGAEDFGDFLANFANPVIEEVSMMGFGCDNNNNNNNNNCVDEYWNNLGESYGFSGDFEANQMVITTLGSDQLASLVKDVHYGMFLDAETCQSNYLETFENFLQEASMSENVDEFYRNFLLGFNEQMNEQQN